MKVWRREARNSASRAVTVRPAATVHTWLTPVTHTLSHIELVGDNIAEVTGDAAARTAPATAPSVRLLV